MRRSTLLLLAATIKWASPCASLEDRDDQFIEASGSKQNRNPHIKIDDPPMSWTNLEKSYLLFIITTTTLGHLIPDTPPHKGSAASSHQVIKLPWRISLDHVTTSFIYEAPSKYWFSDTMAMLASYWQVLLFPTFDRASPSKKPVRHNPWPLSGQARNKSEHLKCYVCFYT